MTDDSNAGPPADLVVLHHAATPSEAMVVKGVLEDAGIRTFIPDRNTPLPGVDLTPYGTDGVAGCEIFVSSEDLERAKTALEEARAEGDKLDES